MENIMEQGQALQVEDMEQAERLSRLLEQDYRRYPRPILEEQP